MRACICGECGWSVRDDYCLFSGERFGNLLQQFEANGLHTLRLFYLPDTIR